MTCDDRPLEQATPLLVMLVTESCVRPYELASKHHSPIMLPHCAEPKHLANGWIDCEQSASEYGACENAAFTPSWRARCAAGAPAEEGSA